jgi:hypothetical protein
MPGFDQVRPGQGSYLERFQVTRASGVRSAAEWVANLSRSASKKRERASLTMEPRAGEYAWRRRPELRRKCVY